MKIFKTFTLKWWQTGVFKWGLLALGIAVGAYWHQVFEPYLVPLLILAVVCLAYITCVWWKQ